MTRFLKTKSKTESPVPIRLNSRHCRVLKTLPQLKHYQTLSQNIITHNMKHLACRLSLSHNSVFPCIKTWFERPALRPTDQEQLDCVLCKLSIESRHSKPDTLLYFCTDWRRLRWPWSRPLWCRLRASAHISAGTVDWRLNVDKSYGYRLLSLLSFSMILITVRSKSAIFSEVYVYRCVLPYLTFCFWPQSTLRH